MCQSNAYLLKDGNKELIMEDVSQVIPGEDNMLVLTGLLGEEKKIKARIKELLLTDHQIIFEEV